MEMSDKDETQEWGGTPEKMDIEGARETLRRARRQFKTGGTMSTLEEARTILGELTVLTCPSGVKYGLKKVSAKAMGMFFKALGTDTTLYGEKSLEMIGNIEEWAEVIYEHILSPKVEIHDIPGADLREILTYMIFEISMMFLIQEMSSLSLMIARENKQ